MRVNGFLSNLDTAGSLESMELIGVLHDSEGESISSAELEALLKYGLNIIGFDTRTYSYCIVNAENIHYLGRIKPYVVKDSIMITLDGMPNTNKQTILLTNIASGELVVLNDLPIYTRDMDKFKVGSNPNSYITYNYGCVKEYSVDFSAVTYSGGEFDSVELISYISLAKVDGVCSAASVPFYYGLSDVS